MRVSKKILALGTVLVVAGATVTCSACSAGYLLRAGIAEARILAARQPIPEVIDAPGTDEETRRKLRLVLTAREFARHSLKLDAGESYTTFTRVERDTLALVLSAAEKDRFALVTWWFPIVGRVPYKGFFDEDDALEAQRKLERDGFDTYVRPTGAFSTLGWFNDPLLSTVLRYDDVGLASTVIHELTHNTIYVPGQAAFNESFATFVGFRGAIELFCGVEGEEGPRCREARAEWADNLLYAHFLSGLVAELERLYGRDDLTREQKLDARERVFADARRRFESSVRPQMLTRRFLWFPRAPLNNATIIARRLYYDRLDRFEAVYEAHDQELDATIAAVVASAERAREDPWAALETLARPLVAPLPPPDPPGAEPATQPR